MIKPPANTKEIGLATIFEDHVMNFVSERGLRRIVHLLLLIGTLISIKFPRQDFFVPKAVENARCCPFFPFRLVGFLREYLAFAMHLHPDKVL